MKLLQMIVHKRILSLLTYDAPQQSWSDCLTRNVYTACSFGGCYGKRENIFSYMRLLPRFSRSRAWKEAESHTMFWRLKHKYATRLFTSKSCQSPFNVDNLEQGSYWVSLGNEQLSILWYRASWCRYCMASSRPKIFTLPGWMWNILLLWK